MNSNDEQRSYEQRKEHTAEEATQAVYLTQGELHAIQKALLFLKFECEETSSLLYAGSPLLNSALSKMREVDANSEFIKRFHSRPNDYLEIFMREKLERSYAEEHVSHERTAAERNEIWRSCMFPFPADPFIPES